MSGEQLSPDRRWRWDGAKWQRVRADQSRATWIARFRLSVFDLRWERSADWRVFAAAAVVAAATDTVLQAPQLGLAATLLVVIIGPALWATGRVRGPQAALMLGAAGLLATGFTFRRSPWLVIPDAVAVALLVGGACGMRGAGSLLNLPLAEALVRAARTLVNIAAGASFAVRSTAALVRGLDGDQRARGRAILRGLAFAIPIVTVLGTLLARADPIFASFFEPRSNPGAVAGHLPGLIIGAWLLFGLCRAASTSTTVEVLNVGWRMGRIEALVVLGALDLVFGAFTVAQVVAATGGGRDAIRAHGLTYADYAHSGFFELLWVAGITLVLLLVLRSVVDQAAPMARRSFLIFAELAIVFTLVIVGVAFQRLSLYEGVYGFTMLRLYCQLFSAWIALSYIALAVTLTLVGRRRHWFAATMAGTALIGLLLLNVVNPEALITRLNLAEAHQTNRLDTAYLSSLSDDAVPQLVTALPGLDGTDAVTVRNRLCSARDTDAGWSGLNLSAQDARAATRSACR
jgi:hypothetical protein